MIIENYPKIFQVSISLNQPNIFGLLLVVNHDLRDNQNRCFSGSRICALRLMISLWLSMNCGFLRHQRTRQNMISSSGYLSVCFRKRPAAISAAESTSKLSGDKALTARTGILQQLPLTHPPPPSDNLRQAQLSMRAFGRCRPATASFQASKLHNKQFCSATYSVGIAAIVE